jgi:hypothetical protein
MIYEVDFTVKKLKNSYSMGYDEFPEIVIKHCGQYFIKHLVLMFHLSVQSGTFPDMLKISKIKPIPKGGDKRDILKTTGQYRYCQYSRKYWKR